MHLEGEMGRIKRLINKGASAIHRKDLLTIADLISPSYNDPDGNDRRSLIFVIDYTLEQYRSVNVHLRNFDITINDNTAFVKIEATVTFNLKDNPTWEYDTFEASLTMIQEDSGWKIQKIELKDKDEDKLRRIA